MLSKGFRVFLEDNSAYLLQIIEVYLRQQLKVPKYSEMYEDVVQFNTETA